MRGLDASKRLCIPLILSCKTRETASRVRIQGGRENVDLDKPFKRPPAERSVPANPSIGFLDTIQRGNDRHHFPALVELAGLFSDPEKRTWWKAPHRSRSAQSYGRVSARM